MFILSYEKDILDPMPLMPNPMIKTRVTDETGSCITFVGTKRDISSGILGLAHICDGWP